MKLLFTASLACATAVATDGGLRRNRVAAPSCPVGTTDPCTCGSKGKKILNPAGCTGKTGCEFVPTTPSEPMSGMSCKTKPTEEVENDEETPQEEDVVAPTDEEEVTEDEDEDVAVDAAGANVSPCAFKTFWDGIHGECQQGHTTDTQVCAYAARCKTDTSADTSVQETDEAEVSISSEEEGNGDDDDGADTTTTEEEVEEAPADSSGTTRAMQPTSKEFRQLVNDHTYGKEKNTKFCGPWCKPWVDPKIEHPRNTQTTKDGCAPSSRLTKADGTWEKKYCKKLCKGAAELCKGKGVTGEEY